MNRQHALSQWNKQRLCVIRFLLSIPAPYLLLLRRFHITHKRIYIFTTDKNQADAQAAAAVGYG